MCATTTNAIAALADSIAIAVFGAAVLAVAALVVGTVAFVELRQSEDLHALGATMKSARLNCHPLALEREQPHCAVRFLFVEAPLGREG
jgi:hypothetical protein